MSYTYCIVLCLPDVYRTYQCVVINDITVLFTLSCNMAYRCIYNWFCVVIKSITAIFTMQNVEYIPAFLEILHLNIKQLIKKDIFRCFRWRPSWILTYSYVKMCFKTIIWIPRVNFNTFTCITYWFTARDIPKLWVPAL